MRVYVDELPKSCGDCPMCRSGKLKLQRKGRYIEAEQCVFGQYKHQTIDDEIDTCPLQSITDYTKQVREKVCEEIRKWCNRTFNWVGDGTGYDGQDYNEMIGSNNTINKLRELLDQIEKGGS